MNRVAANRSRDAAARVGTRAVGQQPPGRWDEGAVWSGTGHQRPAVRRAHRLSAQRKNARALRLRSAPTGERSRAASPGSAAQTARGAGKPRARRRRRPAATACRPSPIVEIRYHFLFVVQDAEDVVPLGQRLSRGKHVRRRQRDPQKGQRVDGRLAPPQLEGRVGRAVAPSK